MDIRQQGTEGFQNESSNTVPQTIPQATTNEMNGLSPLSFLPMNEYEEIMALLTDDNDISQQDHTWIQPKTFLTSEEEDSVELLFQLDHSFSIEEILGEDQTLSSQTQVGGSSSHELRDFVEQSVTTDTTSTIPLDSNSSDRMNISISPGVVVSNVSTTTFGERSSNEPAQQLGDNMGVFNPIFSSENFSTSSLSMPENNPNVWPSGSDAFYPPRAGASFGDSTFPNTTGNSFTQFESPSFSVHPYGCASASFGTSASASDLVGDSVTQFPVFPYAGPVVGSGAAANNLDGNFPVHPYVGASASTSVGPIAGPSTTTFVGTGAGAKNLDGNSLIRHQSSGFPVHTYGSDSADAGGIASASGSASDARVFSGAADANASPYGSNEQFTRDHRFEMSRTNPLAAPSTMGANTCASPVPMMTRYNQTKSFPRQPVLMDIKDLVQSWEGCLVERIHPYRRFFNHAKAWKKPISPVTLTEEWTSKMEITHYVPNKAVIHTIRVYGGFLDYMLFEVNQFGNLELYDHLMSEQVYAKIVLPSHTLLLSTTERMNLYIGSVFEGDAVFVQPP